MMSCHPSSAAGGGAAGHGLHQHQLRAPCRALCFLSSPKNEQTTIPACRVHGPHWHAYQHHRPCRRQHSVAVASTQQTVAPVSAQQGTLPSAESAAVQHHEQPSGFQEAQPTASPSNRSNSNINSTSGSSAPQAPLYTLPVMVCRTHTLQPQVCQHVHAL